MARRVCAPTAPANDVIGEAPLGRDARALVSPGPFLARDSLPPAASAAVLSVLNRGVGEATLDRRTGATSHAATRGEWHSEGRPASVRTLAFDGTERPSARAGKRHPLLPAAVPVIACRALPAFGGSPAARAASSKPLRLKARCCQGAPNPDPPTNALGREIALPRFLQRPVGAPRPSAPADPGARRFSRPAAPRRPPGPAPPRHPGTGDRVNSSRFRRARKHYIRQSLGLAVARVAGPAAPRRPPGPPFPTGNRDR